MIQSANRAGRVSLALTASLCWFTSLAGAQTPSTSQSPAGAFQLPTVFVNAQKEPADRQQLPVSVTSLGSDVLRDAGIETISDAAPYAPNVHFTEFTARKLSNARFRGIGASPANPAITTYLDGVPQLNANSSSITLIGVEQLEMVRGPQSALFGRNVLGGVINVVTARPSLANWTGRLAVPLANASARDLRAEVAGPLVDGTLGLGLAMQYGRRDGFTTNDLSGNDLDRRSSFSGKAQLLWTPAGNWETRVIVSGERSRDGDYALADLGQLRSNPFHTARDFEGHTDRDIVGTTVLARREGARVNLSTTTGFVRWKTDDATDLDYTPLPLATRDNEEKSVQFTQEVRLASAAQAPLRLSDGMTFKWQAGVFLFTQNYEQDAINSLAPFVLSPLVPFAVRQQSPRASLDDAGLGVYGQGTATAGRLDLTAGARVDHEQKDATLSSAFEPAIAPVRNVEADRSFSNVSPQVAAAFRLQPDKMLYVSLARGFKAGGFNAASPVGGESYGEEHTWSVEGGVKTAWARNRVMVNAAVYRIDWDDLQLNLPDLGVPGQFYIANVGGAVSSGAEVELTARLHPGVDAFGSLGLTRAHFKDGSFSSGVDVSGNDIPNTPEYTAALGTQISRQVRPLASVYARGEVTLHGAFRYDEANIAGEDSYALANFRLGARGRHLFVDGWLRNAFDTRYVPLAFAYGPLAPSGFIGEMGRPRTFGVTAGVDF